MTLERERALIRTTITRVYSILTNILSVSLCYSCAVNDQGLSPVCLGQKAELCVVSNLLSLFCPCSLQSLYLQASERVGLRDENITPDIAGNTIIKRIYGKMGSSRINDFSKTEDEGGVFTRAICSQELSLNSLVRTILVFRSP